MTEHGGAMSVVLATDGSPCAQTAIALMASLHWPAGTAIHLVSVVEPSETLLAAPFVPGASLEFEDQLGELIEESEVVLGHAARSLAGTGARIDAEVLRGRAASAIVDKAEAVHADLIVLGSRGHGTIGTMLLGSVSAEVADHAHCPVLVARDERLTRAVLGIDGSSYARAAEDVVAGWPLFESVAIEVVSVAALGLPWTSSLALSGYEPPAAQVADAEKSLISIFREAADQAAARLLGAGRRASARVLQGDAAAELLRVAAEHQADLLIVGTHGRTGLRRLLAGSVARNVMLHAPCSVLVVRERRPLR